MAPAPHESLHDENRQRLLSALPSKNPGALWKVYAKALTLEPVRREIPARWTWTDIKPLLCETPRWIPSKDGGMPGAHVAQSGVIRRIGHYAHLIGRVANYLARGNCANASPYIHPIPCVLPRGDVNF